MPHCEAADVDAVALAVADEDEVAPRAFPHSISKVRTEERKAQAGANAEVDCTQPRGEAAEELWARVDDCREAYVRDTRHLHRSQ